MGSRALVLLAAISAGCLPHREELTRGLEGARDIAAQAEPCFIATKQAEEQACAQDAQCLARVRAAWSHIADSLDALHAAWCVLAPASEGCS